MCPIKNIKGLVSGRLTVIRPHGRHKGTFSWECQCECGNTAIVKTSLLTRKIKKSCGCLSKDGTVRANYKNGLWNTREHAIWIGMIARCHNPEHRYYKNYGGRGIKVCDRWRFSLSAFVEDMGRVPEGHQLDRFPNNNGDYEPGNCRWTTPKQNNRNRRNNILITLEGETKVLSEWVEFFGLNYSTVWRRYKDLGWTIEKSLTEPVIPTEGKNERKGAGKGTKR